MAQNGIDVLHGEAYSGLNLIKGQVEPQQLSRVGLLSSEEKGHLI